MIIISIFHNIFFTYCILILYFSVQKNTLKRSTISCFQVYFWERAYFQYWLQAFVTYKPEKYRAEHYLFSNTFKTEWNKIKNLNHLNIRDKHLRDGTILYFNRSKLMMFPNWSTKNISRTFVFIYCVEIFTYLTFCW